MNYQTIRTRLQAPIGYIQLDRPEANNTINDLLVAEMYQALALFEESATIVILEGLPDVFCFGADFQGIKTKLVSGQTVENNPESLYDLWLKMVNGPYIVISHVRGKVNAGGIGFVAASDLVLADQTARFSLSELLFGLFPACVLPFLIRRIGFQKAHYLTLMTRPLSVQTAHSVGLVDAYDSQSENLIQKHLLRLRYLSKTGISRYKRYLNQLDDVLLQSRSMAISANREIFADPINLEGIVRYVEKGQLPWER
ncbi:MAG: enoyl-CoA hydratase/isomerase [Bacillota bacterium]|jgi:polyketide biosynthesis enoyl-CoA hydratase PksH